MCDGTDQYERVPACPADRCKAEFAAVHTKLDRLDEAIRGNGKPGIQVRLDRLETVQAGRARLLWLIAGSVVTLAVGGLWRMIAGG